jgi:hypothetical protein
LLSIIVEIQKPRRIDLAGAGRDRTSGTIPGRLA